MDDMPTTFTINGVDYVTDEEAAAAVREARRSAFEEAAAHAYQLAGKPREGTFDGDDIFLLLTDFGDAIRDMDACGRSDEAAAAAVREATKPLLAEIERLKMQAHYLALDHKTIEPLLAEIAVKDTAIDTRDAYIGDLAARITERDATIADLRAEIERLRNVELRSADITIAERDATIAELKAVVALQPGPVTAADVQRARERVSPRFGETILPAMTIPDDGRVDAGMKERDWFETPMSLISSPPVADGIPEWSGADGGRDG